MNQPISPGAVVSFRITAWGMKKMVLTGRVTGQSLDHKYTTLELHPFNEVRTIETRRLTVLEDA